MRACVVTLTVLLVESPQLDLVGFVLGLLLQPAGPVGGRGGGRGGRGGRVFHHQSLEFINRQHTHTHNLKASRGFPVQRRLQVCCFFSLRLPALRLLLRFYFEIYFESSSADVTEGRRRLKAATEDEEEHTAI